MKQEIIPIPFVGVGIYTIPDASRLTGINPTRIRRWVRGSSYNASGKTRFSQQVLNAQLPEIEAKLALGFLDLMEVRFVDAFRQVGVPWREIRAAAARAREVFGDANPFAQRRFVTDGREIFARIFGENGDEELLALVKNQYAFERIVSPSLTRSLDFDEDSGKIDRWWIAGRNRRIVVDPARQFGQPIISTSDIPTQTLYDAYLAEGDYSVVSKHYNVDATSIRQAVEFEEQLAA